MSAKDRKDEKQISSAESPEFSEHLKANELFDVYGSLLTARQQEILSLYYQDDLSLSEIQENLGISRAAVSDAVHKGLRAMNGYESRLGLIEKRNRILKLLDGSPLSEKIRAVLYENNENSEN